MKRASLVLLFTTIAIIGACHAPESPVKSASTDHPVASSTPTNQTKPQPYTAPTQPKGQVVRDPSAGPTLELVVNRSKAKAGDTIVISVKNRREEPFNTDLTPTGICSMSFFTHHWTRDGKGYSATPPVDNNVSCPAIALLPRDLHLEPGETKEILTVKAGPVYAQNVNTPITLKPGHYLLHVNFSDRSLFTDIEVTE